MTTKFTKRRDRLGSLGAMEERSLRYRARAVPSSPDGRVEIFGRNLALINENKSLRELLRRRNAERSELMLEILRKGPLASQKVDKSTQTTNKEQDSKQSILLRSTRTSPLIASPPSKGVLTKLASPPNITTIRKSPLPKRGRGAAQGISTLQTLAFCTVEDIHIKPKCSTYYLQK